MNLRGVERAIATEVIDDIGMVIPASDAFAQRNQGMTVDAACEEALRVFERAAQAGKSYQLTIAVAFGCPFSGATPLESCVAPSQSASRSLDSGSLPSRTPSAWRRLARSAAPCGCSTALGSAVPLRAHFHNTRAWALPMRWPPGSLGWRPSMQALEVSEDAPSPRGNGKYSDGRAALRA